MKNVYFTVGPTQLYPTVKKHIENGLQKDVPSQLHRGTFFEELYKDTTTVLREFYTIPKSYHIFFTGSSTESMERIIQNTVAGYSWHLVTGAFAKRFYQTAVEMKKLATKKDFTDTLEVSELPIPTNTELLCITQNETSTGIEIAMKDVYALKKKYPFALIALDVVSSVPYVDIDFSKIDMTIFSVQKGFGLPAGLGVMIVNEKAIEKAQFLQKKGISIGSYHNFLNLQTFEKKFQTPETPNVFGIYLFNKVLKDFVKLGREKIQKDTQTKAALLYEFFNNHPIYSPVAPEQYQSKTTLVLNVKGRTKELIARLGKKGIFVGIGYGEYKNEHIRISNFPAHTIAEVKSLLAALKEI